MRPDQRPNKVNKVQYSEQTSATVVHDELDWRTHRQHHDHKAQKHNREERLIQGNSLFQLEDTCGRSSATAMLWLLQSPRRCGCCCCYCCCCGSGCCTCVLRQVQHEVQSVLTALSNLSVCLSFPPFLLFCLFGERLGLSGPVFISSLLTARQTRRLPLALRMCGPLSTRIHHALCHHVMCLFDTWHSSCTEFAFSCCPPGPSPRPRAPPGLSLRYRAPPGPQLLFLAQLVLPEHSLPSRSS